MARLIDADALLVKQTNIAKTFARSDAQKSLMGRVMYNTEHAPTIDAIPVEWIVSWINRHPNDLRCVWFASLEMEWQKEQEAR